jgi:hypothetical protein
VIAAPAPAAQPAISFRVFARTGHDLDSVVWTGSQFLYVENTANTVWSAPPAGVPLSPFAHMPNLVEETRCLLSPGTHGFPAGVVFCHSPDNKIYEISADGSSTTVFATLPVPYPPAADGALAFDTVGRFGYQLVAATGRSGANQPVGGQVFTISSTGSVAQVGTYSGPGADELIIAPAGFGSVGGDALLTLDGGANTGELVAMDSSGQTRTMATLPGGLNPIAVISPASPAAASGAPPAGLYVTNDINQDLYFAAAAQLTPFTGDLIVGSENKAQFWIVEPKGSRFGLLRLRHNLRGKNYSLEGCIYIAPG